LGTLKKMFGFIDLTKGSPLKVLILFSIPVFLTLLLTNALNLVSTLVLKVTVGGDSVTAITQTNSLNAILLNFGLGTCSGFAVIGGHYYGKRDQANTIKAFQNSFYLALLFGVFLTVLGFIVLKPALHLLNVDALYFQKAYEYYIFIIAGFTIIILNQLAMAFLRVMGNSFFPLMVSILMMLLQIGLILLLTSRNILNLDTIGTGIAVVVINIVGLFINYRYLIKKYPFLKIRFRTFRYDGVMGRDLLKQGLPLGFQWSILFVGGFVLTRQLNLFGPDAGKAITVFTNMEAYSSILYATIATSLVTYVSQNFGAGANVRIKQGIKWSLIFVFVSYIIVFILGYALIPVATGIFLPADSINEKVIFYTNSYLFILYPTSILMALAVISRAILQGIKRPLIILLSGFGEMVARIVVSVWVPFLVDANYLVSKSDQAYVAMSFSNFGAWIIAAIIMGVPVLLMFVFNKPLVGKAKQLDLAPALES